MDEFPAIVTGNFLSLTGNRIAPNSEFGMSVYWREADIPADPNTSPLMTQSGQRASLATVEPRQQVKLSVGVTSIPRRGSLYPPPRCARGDLTVHNIGCEPSCVRRRRQSEGDIPTIFLNARLKAASDA